MSAKFYDHDAVLRDWLVGLSTIELTEKYGCPGNLGAVIAKRRGGKRSPEVMKQASIRRYNIDRETIKASPTGKHLKKRKRVADYAKRYDIQRAAVKFGLSESRVRKIANQHGWQPAPQFDREAILKDYLAGMKLFDIAQKYGCNLCYASTLAIKAGVKRDLALRAKQTGRPRKR